MDNEVEKPALGGEAGSPGAAEHGHGHADDRGHTAKITVNEQLVKIQGKTATGAEIKTSAIAQGVLIQLNFVLQEELPNGTSKTVGDQDVVRLRDHLRFTAIAPDDNS